MANRSIREVVESAIAAHITAQDGLTGVQILKGLSVTTQDLPLIVVSCESVGPMDGIAQVLGNYACTVQIGVFTSSDESTALTVHRARAAVVDAAMQDVAGIQSKFTADGDATCYTATFQSFEDSRGDRALGTTITYMVEVVLAAS
jgi:hypothetical protein